MPNQYFLPQNTSEFLFGSAGLTIENRALRLEKYIDIERDSDKCIHIKKISSESAKVNYLNFSEKEKNFLKALNSDNQKISEAFRNKHSVTGRLQSRLLIGMGNASVFETALTFHKPYGFPYIPGTAVKGVLRSFIINEYFGSDEDRAMECPMFIKAFGCGPTKKVPGRDSRRGELVFLDAFPKSIEKLDLDVMTPHYGDYYGNKDQKNPPPTDDGNQTLLHFTPFPRAQNLLSDFAAINIRLTATNSDIKRLEIYSRKSWNFQASVRKQMSDTDLCKGYLTADNFRRKNYEQ
jgi:CRISPR-associated protein Cmr6